jgi:hypothetical protein
MARLCIRCLPDPDTDRSIGVRTTAESTAPGKVRSNTYLHH